MLEEFQLAYDKFGRYGGCRRWEDLGPEGPPKKEEKNGEGLEVVNVVLGK